MKLNCLLFAYDQDLIANFQNTLQKREHLLYVIIKDYNLKVSVRETKIMAFRGIRQMRSKILTKNKVT
jgi:hypothetical protein